MSGTDLPYAATGRRTYGASVSSYGYNPSLSYEPTYLLRDVRYCPSTLLAAYARASTERGYGATRCY
eukprot:381922-Rhodomonas_salina.2